MTGRKVRAPEKTLAVVDHNVPTTDRDAAASRIREQAASRSKRWRRTPPISASNITTAERQAPGHRPHHRSRAGLHAAGHDHRVRRQPHSTHGAFGALAHGIGTSEVEHVLATQTLIQKKAKNMRCSVDGKLPARRHRQGHHPRHHRRDRHGRRHRPRHRIRRRGDPRAVDGRPHDGLQHVHRRRRARRPHRARREDLRLHQGPPEGAQGRSTGTWRCAYWKTLDSRRGRAFRQGRGASTPPSCRRSSPGAPRPRTSSRSPARCRSSRRHSRREQAQSKISARSTTWA